MTLREWRLKKGRYGTEMAAALALSLSGYWAIERGWRKPSEELARRIAEATNGEVLLEPGKRERGSRLQLPEDRPHD